MTVLGSAWSFTPRGPAVSPVNHRGVLGSPASLVVPRGPRVLADGIVGFLPWVRTVEFAINMPRCYSGSGGPAALGSISSDGTRNGGHRSERRQTTPTTRLARYACHTVDPNGITNKPSGTGGEGAT